MACKDCLENCNGLIVSDQCVTYTGPDIPLLGICQGDILSQVEAAIIAELLSVLDGTGITLSNIDTNCLFISDLLGANSPTLLNLIQILIDGECTLKGLIDQINTVIDNNPSFDTSCLTGLPGTPTRDDILQATVLLLCNIKTTVDAIPSTYVTLANLTTLVTNIVNNILSGGGTIAQNNTKMVPYAAIPYFGPLSNFDSGGKGVLSLGFDKIYLCNGNNGTPDIRGRVIVSAVRSVPGPSLDPAVDPSNPNNPNWALNDKAGENKHSLVAAENAPHTHAVIDNGHEHVLTFGKDDGGNRFGNGWMKWDSDGASKSTQNATTGITIASQGSGSAHNNIQPSIAAYYIMYIP